MTTRLLLLTTLLLCGRILNAEAATLGLAKLDRHEALRTQTGKIAIKLRDQVSTDGAIDVEAFKLVGAAPRSPDDDALRQLSSAQTVEAAKRSRPESAVT